MKQSQKEWTVSHDEVMGTQRGSVVYDNSAMGTAWIVFALSMMRPYYDVICVVYFIF
jgi:hypothetical protein